MDVCGDHCNDQALEQQTVAPSAEGNKVHRHRTVYILNKAQPPSAILGSKKPGGVAGVEGFVIENRVP